MVQNTSQQWQCVVRTTAPSRLRNDQEVLIETKNLPIHRPVYLGAIGANHAVAHKTRIKPPASLLSHHLI